MIFLSKYVNCVFIEILILFEELGNLLCYWFEGFILEMICYVERLVSFFIIKLIINCVNIYCNVILRYKIICVFLFDVVEFFFC